MNIKALMTALLLSTGCVAQESPKFKAGQLVKFKEPSFYSLCEGRMVALLSPNKKGEYTYRLQEIECNGVTRLEGYRDVQESELEAVL